jgi:hypothetical protein
MLKTKYIDTVRHTLFTDIHIDEAHIQQHSRNCSSSVKKVDLPFASFLFSTLLYSSSLFSAIFFFPLFFALRFFLFFINVLGARTTVDRRWEVGVIHLKPLFFTNTHRGLRSRRRFPLRSHLVSRAIMTIITIPTTIPIPSFAIRNTPVSEHHSMSVSDPNCCSDSDCTL